MLNRVIYSANGTLSDLSTSLNDYYSSTEAVAYTAGQDKIFIGSRHPFNRKYFKATVPNAVAASLSIRYWDGSAWRSCVEVVDETSTGGKSFAQDGYVSWTPDKRYRWWSDDTTIDGTEKITGLGDVTIYDSYWIELTFSANVSMTLAWLGDLFCTDDDLGAEYPDLVRTAVMTAFESGKTSWEEQRIVASRQVIQDLKAKKLIESADQLLERASLVPATVSKTAEIIFNGLGDSEERKAAAQAQYQSRIDSDLFSIDRNRDGRASPSESAFRQIKAIR